MRKSWKFQDRIRVARKTISVLFDAPCNLRFVGRIENMDWSDFSSKIPKPLSISLFLEQGGRFYSKKPEKQYIPF